MIREEVTAAEQEEVFGSMSAVVSARGVNARRGGFVVEGCCMRRPGMGANRGSKLSHGATKEERNGAGC